MSLHINSGSLSGPQNGSQPVLTHGQLSLSQRAGGLARG